MAASTIDADNEYVSKINYKNMIQNLADMYPYDIDEVILVECIANSLDARSTKIFINFKPESNSLLIRDNGAGMSASQFRLYHDFAMGLKSRGEGIGFAGLGAKISFNIANRVITETRSKSFSGGSNWRFSKNGDLVWKPIKSNSMKNYGTKVEIFFNEKSNICYKTPEKLKEALFRHYAPLFDEKFLEFYNIVKCYEKPPSFIVNDTPIMPINFIEEYGMDKHIQKVIKTSGKKRKPLGYAFFGLVSEKIELDTPGILLCTWGKVIKPDFLNQFPGELMSRIFGIADIPNFVKFLTTSKCDFNRTKNPIAFNTYYKPLRDIFVSWLKELGIDSSEEKKEEESKAIEREILKIISSLPEIPELMRRRASKKVHVPSKQGEDPVVIEKGVLTFPVGEGKKGETKGILEPHKSGEGEAYKPNRNGTEKAKKISRKSKVGPKIAFRNVPEKEEMGWVDSDIVFINSGHPGYKKTSSNKKSRLIFNLFSVAIALQRYLDSGDEKFDLTFIDKFMHAWGK